MADIRINALATTAASTASDDFVAVDGSANGTRKLNAYSPTFGGNLTVSGTGTFSGAINANADGTNIVFKTFGTTPQSALWTNNDGTMTWGDYATGTKSLKLNTTNGNATLGGNLTVSGTASGIGGTNTGGGEILTIRGSGTSAQLRIAGAGSDYVQALTVGYDTTNGYGFLQANHAGVGTKPLVVQSSGGNFLVGTTTDGGQKLQVAGDGIIAKSAANTNVDLLTLKNSAYNVGESASLLFAHGGAPTSRISSYLPGSNQTEVVISTSNTSGVLTEAVRFTGSQNATFAGTVIANASSNAFRITNSQTPASASATGTAGTIAWDASYIYVCTATNTWKRVAIATW